MDIDKIQRVVCLVLAIVLIITLAHLIFTDIRNLLTVLYTITLIVAFLWVIDDDG